MPYLLGYITVKRNIAKNNIRLSVGWGGGSPDTMRNTCVQVRLSTVFKHAAVSHRGCMLLLHNNSCM